MKESQIKVTLLDVMGSDLTVVNSARVSFDKYHEYLDENDEGLIRYLARFKHWSPFAHPQLSFRIKAPLFVARQLAKHQVGLTWNEVSRRYVDSEPEYYMPTLRARAEKVKQGSLESEIERVSEMKKVFEDSVHLSDWTYKELLRNDVAPEVARSVLPQNMMTEWIWTGSLYAFSRVINLRLDSHAQKESQEVAKAISEEVRAYFPLSYKALVYGYLRH